jgi:polysaccharide biosynthesis protein PelG
MAGIGFILEKLVKRGGFSAIFRVALAGTVIVAGPWLLSIAAITLVSVVVPYSGQEAPALFSLAIVYANSVSLILFGGFHYLFSRLVSDFVYAEDFPRASALLVVFVLAAAVVSALVAVAGLFGVDPSALRHVGFYRTGVVLLFVGINLTFLLMLFLSLSKRYATIVAVYAAGMVLSVGGAWLLGGRYGTGGAMTGYGVGQVFIAAALLILSLVSFPPGRLDFGFYRRIPRRMKVLFLGGAVYTFGVWVDKLVYWITLGTTVRGSVFRLNDPYDLPFFFANLSIIPGLVFFVVMVETDFFRAIQGFLESLGTGIYMTIQQRKYQLRTTMRGRLAGQSAFQGIITLALVVASPQLDALLWKGGIDVLTMRIALVAAWAHLLLITLIIFLFYLERFDRVLRVACVFLVLNLSFSLLTAALGLARLAGLGYILSAGASSALAYRFLLFDMGRFDRIIYAGSAE